MSSPTANVFPFSDQTVREVIERASSNGYESWWSRTAGTGYCASPIHLIRSGMSGDESVTVRCKNRRQIVCPSCSDLYAGDTWHLVHAGLAGSVDVPAAVSGRPAVFVTLTAPSFGPVHTIRSDGRACHPGYQLVCSHHIAVGCKLMHSRDDELLGQPLCLSCYDYVGHVLFTWHAPELWGRFAIDLRRQVRRAARAAGHHEPRVSFVKVMEMQRRGSPHFHAVVRLDPNDDDDSVLFDTRELVRLVGISAARVHLDVTGYSGELVTLRFGPQVDVQALDGYDFDPTLGRKVSGYLAKYVTKSVSDFGLTPRRIAPSSIDRLDTTEHYKNLLRAIARLAEGDPDRAEMTNWLHTLGYRGHVTTKSRRYSTTMGALRARRAAHMTRVDVPLIEDDTEWTFRAAGHRTSGERLLAISAAIAVRESRWAARQLTDDEERQSL